MITQGKRILASGHGVARIDNKDILGLTGITIDVEMQYEEHISGMGTENTLVGSSGSGTLSVDVVKTLFTEQFKKLLKGRELAFDLYANVSDPDSTDGQIETVVIKDCKLTNLPLGFGETGTTIKKEYSFNFNPQKASFVDEIK